MQLVKNLIWDLALRKSHLSNYRSVTGNLTDKQRVLVEALYVVNTLLTTYTSEEKQQRSLACTTRPHKIDSEADTAIPRECNSFPPFDSFESSTSTSPSPLPLFPHPSPLLHLSYRTLLFHPTYTTPVLPQPPQPHLS